MNKKNVIRLTESDLKNIIKEAVKSVLDITEMSYLTEAIERNTTNKPEDFDYIFLTADYEIDGCIKKPGGGCSIHPLAVAINIPPTMWKALGMPYSYWVSQILEDDEYADLQKSGFDINNPPTGFVEFINFERNRNIMWVSINDIDVPLPAHLHKPMFEYGGELYHVSPTSPKAQQYIKILRIGNYV